MRTIKFRGKDIETGEWLYGDLFLPLGRFPSIINTEPDINGKVAYIQTCVKKETVCQFTGLTDKNGKEIYEGDILIWGENECKSKPLIVCFKHGSFGYIYCDWFHSFAGNRNFTFNPFNTDIRFEVIGNIHDNPELIKGGKE